MSRVFKQEADVVTLTAPVGGTTIGVGVLIGNILGVALETKVAGELVDVQRTGSLIGNKVSAQAWTIGQKIYWDDTAKLFTTVPTAVFAGYAHTRLAAAGTQVAANPSASGEFIIEAATGGQAQQGPVITVSLPLNGDAVDQVIYIADRAYRVLSVSEVHAVAGSDGGAVTLDVKKQTGVQTPAQGVTTLATTFDMKATANTTVTKTGAGLSAVAADLLLAAGNRLSLDFTGVTTAVAGVVVTVSLEVV